MKAIRAACLAHLTKADLECVIHTYKLFGGDALVGKRSVLSTELILKVIWPW